MIAIARQNFQTALSWQDDDNQSTVKRPVGVGRSYPATLNDPQHTWHPFVAVPRLLKERCPVCVFRVSKTLGPVLKPDMKWHCKGFILVQEVWQYIVPFGRYNHLTLDTYMIKINLSPSLHWSGRCSGPAPPKKPIPKMRSAIVWEITQLIGPIGSPETSIKNYHYTLRNFPEEWKPETIYIYIYIYDMIYCVNRNWVNTRWQ
jgi:hypothetical protein